MDRNAVDPAAVDAAGAVDVQGGQGAAVCSSHTAGPWLVDPESDGTTVGRLADDGSGFVVPIAFVDLEGLDEDNYGQAYADARLIASAPDLLAALRDFLLIEHAVCAHERELRRSKGMTKTDPLYSYNAEGHKAAVDEYERCKESAHAALAKATGTAH